MMLYHDNKEAINIAHNSIHHDIIKHVEIELHFIKEKIRQWTSVYTLCFINYAVGLFSFFFYLFLIRNKKYIRKGKSIRGG